MRKNNLFRVVILIFLLSAILVSAVGCHNSLPDESPNNSETDKQNTPSSDQNTPTDSEQAMVKKWEEIVVNVDADIRSLDIKKYTIQPAYSSITTKVQVFTLEDSNDIEEFLSIMRELSVSFEDFKFDESEINEINEFYSSHIGKQVIEIMLKDSNETDIFGLCLYENGDIDIIEAREVTETKKTYRHIYRVYFENSNTDVYAAIASFYENSLTE